MDSKTPVTLLNEFLLKNKDSPEYQLIHNGVGTHDPLFVYEVCGLGKRAVGSGKSKREAKHAAAQALLIKFKESENSLEDIVQSPYADILKENAIGALQDFCSRHMINNPTYIQTRDEGLPHAKLFGIKCKVSSLSTQAEARTKKQAKQMAAQLMLEKLRECLNEEGLFDFVQKPKSEIIEENEARGNERLEEYFAKQDMKIPQARPLGTPLDHYDRIFKQDVFVSSETYNCIKGKDRQYFAELNDPMELLMKLVRELNLTWFKDEMPVKKELNKRMFALILPELNQATFLGMGLSESEALKSAAASGLYWLSIMGM